MNLFLLIINVFLILGLILAQTTSSELNTTPEQNTAPVEECQVYYSLRGGNDGSCCKMPTCMCDNNSHIIGIFIENAKIKEIPSEIIQIKELNSLQLNNNKIKEIPNELFQLNNLSFLELNGNEIEVIPSSIKDSELIGLELKNNKIKEFPKEVFSMKKLKSLDLYGNDIENIPEDEINKIWKYIEPKPVQSDEHLFFDLQKNPVCKDSKLSKFFDKPEYNIYIHCEGEENYNSIIIVICIIIVLIIILFGIMVIKERKRNNN